MPSEPPLVALKQKYSQAVRHAGLERSGCAGREEGGRKVGKGGGEGTRRKSLPGLPPGLTMQKSTHVPGTSLSSSCLHFRSKRDAPCARSCLRGDDRLSCESRRLLSSFSVRAPALLSEARRSSAFPGQLRPFHTHPAVFIPGPAETCFSQLSSLEGMAHMEHPSIGIVGCMLEDNHDVTVSASHSLGQGEG